MVSCEAARGCLAMKKRFDEVQAEADGMRQAQRQCSAERQSALKESAELKARIKEIEDGPDFWDGVLWGAAAGFLAVGLTLTLTQ